MPDSSESFLVLRPHHPSSIKTELVVPTLSVLSDWTERISASASGEGLLIFRQLIRHMAGIMVTSNGPKVPSLFFQRHLDVQHYKQRHSKLFHSRKKRHRWHVGRVNVLKERKSGVMVSNSTYLSSISCWSPYQTTISWLCCILDSGICWHLQNSLNGAVWIVSGASFPESKTKVDPNETAFLAIKNAFEDKENQIHFVSLNKLDQSMPVFDLKVSSWHLAQRAGTQMPFLSFPWRSTKWSRYHLCFSVTHRQNIWLQNPLVLEGKQGRWLKPSKVIPTCCLLQPQPTQG